MLIRQKQQTPHFLSRPTTARGGPLSLVDAIHATSTHPRFNWSTYKDVKKEDIEAAFHALNLCTHEEQKSDGEKANKAKQSK